MRFRTAPKWLLALVVSAAIHLTTAAAFLSEPPSTRIEGGGATEITLAASSGAEAAVETPVDQALQEAVETEAVEAPLEVEPAEPVDAATPVETADAAITSPVETATAPAPETGIAPAAPTETVTALANIPLPTPRPAYTPPPKPQKKAVRAKQVQKKVQAQTQAKTRQAEVQPKKKQAAPQGQAQAARRAGKKTAARNTAAGNAAVSNYPGKVASRLRRALKYPREARRQKLRGEVRVSFTVNRNGGVSGIRVVRSSGSSILDQAAIATVQRAAPFPRIPAQAGRNSWPFTIPLAFQR
ncbi:TonB family protein [Nitratireductor basaltis]|uniref:Protein TonB n=1 Tax=Nitratireductor basaltis TaxID=472175 RepID=A0A084UA29_9HYPH|nr:energy transducer TonB [Nitratireductor basaltis]KFB09815.1 TonB family protein [Nitratireductor basaltis]